MTENQIGDPLGSPSQNQVESQFEKAMVECPVCLNEESVTIWQVINGSTDPDLKDKLLRKELQTHLCSNCGNRSAISQPLLYLDPERHLMYYCRASQSEAQTQAALQELPGLIGWQMRRVEDYNQLIEKIHIADHHGDDRLIELIKLSVIRQQEQEGGIRQIYFLTADDSAFRYIVCNQDEEWCTLDLGSEIYLNAEKLAAKSLPDISGQWQAIDRSYAEKLLAQLAAAG